MKPRKDRKQTVEKRKKIACMDIKSKLWIMEVIISKTLTPRNSKPYACKMITYEGL
jgi:hypothetical protein